jgi:hypothetical protein
VLALSGRDGCESHVKLDENEKADVVGSTNGYGIALMISSLQREKLT